jgi:hypothetical protein
MVYMIRMVLILDDKDNRLIRSCLGILVSGTYFLVHKVQVDRLAFTITRYTHTDQRLLYRIPFVLLVAPEG